MTYRDIAEEEWESEMWSRDVQQGIINGCLSDDIHGFNRISDEETEE